jgi:glycosyltransferase involved in cell wall biosynthesis
MKKIPLLCLVMTSPYFLNSFLSGHVRRWAKSYRIVVLSNFRQNPVPVEFQDLVEFRHIPIERKIAPVHDLLTSILLWMQFWRLRPSAVLTYTPKAGLLGMGAAFLAGIPFRSHFFTGQVWATSGGAKRILLRAMDRVVAFCASRLLADSPSQREFLIAEKVTNAGKIEVLGDGSVGGVNTARFRPNLETRNRVRAELGIGSEEYMLLFIGRINRDKGVNDLLQAFQVLRGEFQGLHLVFVGPDEEGLLAERKIGGVLATGFSPAVETYIAAADILCLPSYREGFGSVLLEAGAIGVPAVASRIYGITDAVVDGSTGLLHEPGKVEDLAEKIRLLLGEPVLREQMGRDAKKRVEERFAGERLETLYFDWLERHVSAGAD